MLNRTAAEGAVGARLLIRLHGVPLGELAFDFGASAETPASLTERIWATLGAEIVAHLGADGVCPVGDRPTVDELTQVEPPCRKRREAAAASVSATVVIATHNRPDSLLRCLHTLTRSTRSDFDVVVVDSAPSDDATARMLREAPVWPFPLRYVSTAVPGLAHAHNVALPQVTGDVVAFTDDDVEVDPAWLSSVTAPFADESVTCVTGLILPAELVTDAQLLIERAGGFGRGFTRRSYALAEPSGDAMFPFAAGRFGSGANMAFRTAPLRRRGGFDPATGAGTTAKGGDDLLGFLQALLDGGRLVYEPAAVVRHYHRRDFDALRRQAFGYGVGLGAYLAAAMATDRRVAGQMMRRAVPAVRHLLAADSVKNRERGADFPRSLIWRERAGVLVGPVAYTVSRRQAARRLAPASDAEYAAGRP